MATKDNPLQASYLTVHIGLGPIHCLPPIATSQSLLTTIILLHGDILFLLKDTSHPPL